MERTKQVAKGVGKVILALVGGALMPIWIWVAFGVAMNQKLHQRGAQREPAPTIGEILAAAGLSIQGEATTVRTTESKVLAQQSLSEVRELVAKAGLTIQEEPAFTHGMERTKQIARGVGKVVLALVGGALMPIWIWVALGVAMNRKLRAREAERELAPATGKTLAANRVRIQHKES